MAEKSFNLLSFVQIRHLYAFIRNCIFTTKAEASMLRYKESSLNTQCKTCPNQSHEAALLVGLLAFICFMNSCGTQKKTTRERLAFVKGQQNKSTRCVCRLKHLRAWELILRRDERAQVERTCGKHLYCKQRDVQCTLMKNTSEKQTTSHPVALSTDCISMKDTLCAVFNFFFFCGNFPHSFGFVYVEFISSPKRAFL